MKKIFNKLIELLKYKILYSSLQYKFLLLNSFIITLFFLINISYYHLSNDIIINNIIYLICATITLDILHVFDDTEYEAFFPICVGTILACIIFFIEYCQLYC